jgi:hypothetical protein
LLKDHGVAGFEAGEDFSFGAVGDAGLDIDLAAAGFGFGIGDFDGGVAVLIVEDCLFGYGEDVLVFFEKDFGVGGHVGFEFAAGVIDGDADFEGSDVVLLDAERSDLGDLALEGFVLEGLDLDAGGLAEVDLADVGLVDLALDVDLGGVADGHDKGGGGTEDEDGADGVADLDIARENGAVHGRGDGGVAELLFELLEGGLGLSDLRLGLAELGGVDADLRDGFVAGVDGEEVFLLRVIKGLGGDEALFGHRQIALVGVLVHGQVGGFGVDPVVLDGGGGCVGVGLGGRELGFLRGDLIEDLLLVELAEDLALLDVVVDVDVEAGDDAGRFGFDLDLGDGLDLAGGDDGAGDVGELGFAQLRGLEFRGVAAGAYGDAQSDDDDGRDEAGPEPEFTLVFTLCSQGVLPYVSG